MCRYTRNASAIDPSLIPRFEKKISPIRENMPCSSPRSEAPRQRSVHDRDGDPSSLLRVPFQRDVRKGFEKHFSGKRNREESGQVVERVVAPKHEVLERGHGEDRRRRARIVPPPRLV